MARRNEGDVSGACDHVGDMPLMMVRGGVVQVTLRRSSHLTSTHSVTAGFSHGPVKEHHVTLGVKEAYRL